MGARRPPHGAGGGVERLTLAGAARRWGLGDPQVRIGTLVGVAGGAVPLLLGPLKLGSQIPDPNENVYRLFMSFYALVFPAYVWLCMIPARGSRTADPTRRTLAVLAAVVLIAGPMFWLAFLGGRMAWALPGLAVVLLGRLFVRPGDAAATIAPATLGAGS